MLMHVLLVEDAPLLGQVIEIKLQERQYQVDWIQSGSAVLSTVRNLHPDIIILDLNLPDIDGLEILKRLRAENISTPVLILTARHAVEERVNGLDLGADDYLTKPFEMDELEARLRAVQRRLHGRSKEEITFGDIKIDSAARQVFFKGSPIEASRREFDLLVLLLNNTGRVMTRAKIEATLYADDVESNALEVHIHNLRKKLGKELISTVRGVGYYVAER